MNVLADFAHPGDLTETGSGRRWDPATTGREVARREAAFLAQGFRPGDRVLILFGNSLEFFAELLAAWRLGGCVIPVDSRLTAFEVEKLAAAAAARFAVTDGSSLATLPSLAGATVRHTRDLPDSPAASPGPASGAAWRQPDDEALILFTSGSTGEPKGVVHTHRSLLARWSALRQHLGLDAYRRTLCLLPTHFGHGLICNCLFPWLSGCDLFIAPPFQPELVLRLGTLIDEHRISFLSSVPSLWHFALRVARPPQDGPLRRVHIGSAPLSEANWARVQQWAGTSEVFNAYGITETGSWVAGTTGEPVVPGNGLIGRPWGATIEVRENRPATGTEASRVRATGEEGMIWLRTPALMKGYFRREDLTREVVHQGWFKTGDIGFVDDRGRLFLKGRERDEINKGGMKIFPADIDAVVEQYPATLDVCAFGFADEFYGEDVGLAVVLENPVDQAVRGLHEFMCRHLAKHKHPVRWYLVDSIPRTSRGKINRDTVRKACMALTPVALREALHGAPS